MKLVPMSHAHLFGLGHERADKHPKTIDSCHRTRSACRRGRRTRRRRLRAAAVPPHLEQKQKKVFAVEPPAKPLPMMEPLPKMEPLSKSNRRSRLLRLSADEVLLEGDDARWPMMTTPPSTEPPRPSCRDACRRRASPAVPPSPPKPLNADRSS